MRAMWTLLVTHMSYCICDIRCVEKQWQWKPQASVEEGSSLSVPWPRGPVELWLPLLQTCCLPAPYSRLISLGKTSVQVFIMVLTLAVLSAGPLGQCRHIPLECTERDPTGICPFPIPIRL